MLVLACPTGENLIISDNIRVTVTASPEQPGMTREVFLVIYISI